MANNEFECMNCGAKFLNQTSLQRHIRMAHSTEEYTCPECGTIHQSEEELDAHIRALHPEEANRPSR